MGIRITICAAVTGLLPLCLAASGKTPDRGPKMKSRVERMTVGHADVWWNLGTQLNPYRLPPPPQGAVVEYEDLTGDGYPDMLRTVLPDGTPVQWIDDNGNMRLGDIEGDMADDCLMIDRNRDGQYGSWGDLIVDWVDTDGDGQADMQVVVDNIPESRKEKSGGGHYMWVLDTDRDNIFNYIDWNTYELRCWLHAGRSDFYTDYHGQSMFMKIHATPERINDIRLNWENPFLFYDPDRDGLTEVTVRLCDSRNKTIYRPDGRTELSGLVDWAAISVDMDNDNTPQHPFDLDMTICFMGEGSDYTGYSKVYAKMRGLPEADRFFMDPAWRRNTELIFPCHEEAFDFIFRKARWDSVWFVFDEDDDCERWERVELYSPGDLYAMGEGNGGLDDHRQSDVAGDRGEWDADNSGGGNLYVSPMDGKIHLYGAEWGAWRIDQRADYYQGMGGIYDLYGPGRQQGQPEKPFPVVKYEDTDGNGFFDKMSFDFDADGRFEEVVSLHELGLDDRCEVIDISKMKYGDYAALFEKVACGMWDNACAAVEAAHRAGLNTSWYAFIMNPKSLRQKYDYGYWLQLYLYHDLLDAAVRKNDKPLAEAVKRAYFSGDWRSLEKR